MKREWWISISAVLPLAILAMACAGVRSPAERCEDRGGVVKEVLVRDLPEEGGGEAVRHYCEVNGKIVDRW